MKRFLVTLFVLMFFVVLGQGVTTATALATSWEYNAPNLSKTYYFTVSEDGIVVPAPTQVKGHWLENWNGTKGGYATLDYIYLSGEVDNINQVEQMYTVEDIVPSADYAGGHNYDIAVSYNWTLKSPDNRYEEGYDCPLLYIYNPSVTGNVEVYAPETNQVDIVKSISWTQ